MDALAGLTEILHGRSNRYSLEYPCHSPTKKRWFMMRAVPLRTRDGGAVVYHINVTHLAEVEEELRQHRAHLEELVVERTEDLTHAVEELESFSYSIAHDLRSPLRTITSFSQVLQKDMAGKFSAEDYNNLQRIIKAGKYMAALIDDILALARISRNALEKKRVDLSQLAEEVVNELRHGDSERQVDVHIQPRLTAEGDAVLLKLLLDNLLNNAWKYTRPCTQASIEMGLDTIEGESVFYIRDNGVGFDMQYAGNLFRPFYRLHNDEQFEGTGIGLATVQRIVQRHGGRVWVNAKEGEGATVYFTL
jgi:light-regulated signal transduction histidine kinase (bacteriophytochrome)